MLSIWARRVAGKNSFLFTQKRLELFDLPFSVPKDCFTQTLSGITRFRRPFMAQTSPTESSNTPIDETENPETYHKVIAKLEGAGIQITKSHHQPVKTSEEAAQVRGISLESGAKAIVLALKLKNNQIDPTFALFVMSATHKLDSKKVKKVTGAKSTSFASPEQVKALTGCIPGAVPPFGSVWGIKTYMDVSLRGVGEHINFNAGLRTDSVQMRQEDYEKVEQPEICEIAIAP